MITSAVTGGNFYWLVTLEKENTAHMGQSRVIREYSCLHCFFVLHRMSGGQPGEEFHCRRLMNCQNYMHYLSMVEVMMYTQEQKDMEEGNLSKVMVEESLLEETSSMIEILWEVTTMQCFLEGKQVPLVNGWMNHPRMKECYDFTNC